MYCVIREKSSEAIGTLSLLSYEHVIPYNIKKNIEEKILSVWQTSPRVRDLPHLSCILMIHQKVM
jgi:hypothetical protein